MTPDRFEALVELYLAALPEAARAASEARHDARFAVERIVFLVDVKRRTGGLSELNAEYQAQRRAGAMRMNYETFLATAVAEAVEAAARNSPPPPPSL